jgi:predicted DNA-binding transcriptional regulator AlpA
MQLAAAPLQQETQSRALPNRAARRSKAGSHRELSDIAMHLQHPPFRERAAHGAGSHIPDRILRLPEVLEMVGIGRTSLYEMVKSRKFPAPLHLSARIRGWRLSAIQQFLISVEGE